MAFYRCPCPRCNREDFNQNHYHAHHDVDEHDDLEIDLHIKFHHDFKEHDDFDYDLYDDDVNRYRRSNRRYR